MIEFKNVNVSTLAREADQCLAQPSIEKQSGTNKETHSQILYRMKELVTLFPDRDVSIKSLPDRAQ